MGNTDSSASSVPNSLPSAQYFANWMFTDAFRDVAEKRTKKLEAFLKPHAAKEFKSDNVFDVQYLMAEKAEDKIVRQAAEAHSFCWHARFYALMPDEAGYPGKQTSKILVKTHDKCRDLYTAWKQSMSDACAEQTK